MGSAEGGHPNLFRLFRFPRFLPICCDLGSLFSGFVPICSVFFRFVRICFRTKQETPFCRPHSANLRLEDGQQSLECKVAKDCQNSLNMGLKFASQTHRACGLVHLEAEKTPNTLLLQSVEEAHLDASCTPFEGRPQSACTWMSDNVTRSSRSIRRCWPIFCLPAFHHHDLLNAEVSSSADIALAGYHSIAMGN